MRLLGITLNKIFPYLHPTSICVEYGNIVSIKKKHNVNVEVKGRNNVITSHGKLYGTSIRIIGTNNEIIMSKDSKVLNSTFVVIGDSCKIIIDEGATIGHHCWLTVMGKGNEIKVGKDSMLADDVDLWASDSHPIFMKNNPEVIINPSGSIHIADHVWIGKRSAVLKNVDIGENTVVGMGSIVTKSVSSSCIVVGSPAKVIREGVNWDRRHINI